MTRLTPLVLLASLTLAGCQTTRFVEPPADKLVCPDEPAVPDKPVTDEKNATYLRGLRAAGAECRADVEWLRVWFRNLNS